MISCDDIMEWHDFTLEKIPYDKTQLRIDGYYYCIDSISYSKDYYQRFCFYKNGVVLDLGSNAYPDLETVDSMIYNNSYDYNEKRLNWGIFNIEENVIKFEKYIASEGFNQYTYIRKGKILNDTTFRITLFYCGQNDDENSVLDEIYHFRAFTPKPDSVNSWIE